MNPIKTPQEMLAEMAGIPHMAGGSAVAGQFDKAIAAAIAKYKQLNKRAPSAQEVEQLKAHVQGLSRPTNPILRSGKDAEARAQFELGTDLNLINPDTARDPFLTKMQLNRTPKGTQLKPKTFDITDPNVTKNIEERQMAGLMDEDIPGASQRVSSTPSADYFGEVSTNLENAALQGGAFDDLKAEFVNKFGRYPNADEVNQIIADYNILRQQYGPKGISIVNERPRTARGMEEFRAEARNEGIEETALTNPPADYPKYLKNELALNRGELPTTAIRKPKKKSVIEPTDFYTDEEGNLVKVFPTMKAEGGHMTPDEMRHMMLVNGHTPQKFAGGGRPGIKELDEWTFAQEDPYDFKPKFQAYDPSPQEKLASKIAPIFEKAGTNPQKAYENAKWLAGHSDSTDNTLMSLTSPTAWLDPLSIPRGVHEVAKGDVATGLTDIALGVPGAYTTYKAAQTAAPKVAQAAKVAPKALGALSRVLGPATLALTPSELGDSSLDAWNKRKAKK